MTRTFFAAVALILLSGNEASAGCGPGETPGIVRARPGQGVPAGSEGVADSALSWDGGRYFPDRRETGVHGDYRLNLKSLPLYHIFDFTQVLRHEKRTVRHFLNHVARVQDSVAR